jgi:hypothetical protein
MAMRVELVCEGYKPLEMPVNHYPMHPYAERLNCIYADSITGERFVFNQGPTIVNSVLSWKCVSREFANSYEYFLLNVIEMGLKPFCIITPSHADFGLGMGVAIPEARYNGNASLKQLIKPSGTNGIFCDIELPYMFVRPDNYMFAGLNDASH